MRIFCFTFILILLASCRKDEPINKNSDYTNPTGTSSLRIHFIHRADTFPLVASQSYTLPNNQSFSVQTFKYYISNVEIYYADGTIYKEDYSYHLIDFQGKNEIILNQLPSKNISNIRFMIGVDSLHNVSGPQTGDLSPVYGMFWTWNTGYIVLKFEGHSPQSGAMDHSLVFHIGGFKGPNKVQRTVTISMPNGVSLKEGKTSELQLITNVSRMFYGVHTIDFSQNYQTMINNKNSADIADNYAQMISFNKFIP